jgi:hypothetical protein
MGLLDNLKNLGSKTIKGINKTIDLTRVTNKANNEAYHLKRTILSKLSLIELKNLSHLLNVGISEYENYIDPRTLAHKKRRIVLNNFDYIDKISRKPSAEIVLKLKHLRKSSLADELEREIVIY